MDRSIDGDGGRSTDDGDGDPRDGKRDRRASTDRETGVRTDGGDGPWIGRYVAVGALGLIGLVLFLSFTLFASGTLDELTFTAEEFDPETEPERATVASEIDDLDEQVEHSPNPEETRAAFDTAVEDGAYEAADGEYPEDLRYLAEGGVQEYAVYEGEYYRLDGTVDSETDRLRLELEPADATEVMDDVAIPYEEASETSRRAIDEGEATGFDFGPRIVEQGGEYYAIEMSGGLDFVTSLVLAPVTIVLRAVGAAFLVVGAWLTVGLVRGDPTPLSAGNGAGLAAGAAVLVAAVSVPGDASPSFALVIWPSLAAATALLTLVGVFLNRSRVLPAVALAIGIPIVVVALAASTEAIVGVLGADPAYGHGSGTFGGGIALFSLFGAGVVGWPLAVYGYFFADDRAIGSTGSEERVGSSVR